MISFLININQWLKRSNVNNIHSLKFDLIICGFTACDKIYYSILFIYYLLDNSWLSYMCLYYLHDKTKNPKRVYLIQTNKKQIQGHTCTMYVNQRDDMLTKTRN
jgi:hypothetical protein